MVSFGRYSALAGIAAGLLMVLAADVSPARADCYEDIGCTDSDMMSVGDLEDLSCQDLWHVRTRIYERTAFASKRRMRAPPSTIPIAG